MKKLISAVIAAVILVSSSSAVIANSITDVSDVQYENAPIEMRAGTADNSIKITLQIGSDKLFNNGVQTILDVPAQIIDDRTMIPLRAIFEALGASVSWDGETQTIASIRDGMSVVMQIGSNKLFRGSEEVVLDVPPQIVADRTLVPVRAVAEAFGCSVDWDGATQTVTIEK